MLLPSVAFALNIGTGPGSLVEGAATKAGYSENTNVTTFSETLGTVVKGALSLVGVIFLVLMVYAGFLWLNARGEESQIEKAQDIIRSSIIGLIITVGAYSITQFVVPRIISRATGGSAAVGTGAGSCVWVLRDGSSPTSLDTDGSQQGVATRQLCQAACNNAARASAPPGSTSAIVVSCTLDGVSAN